MLILNTEPQLPDNVQSPGVHPQKFALWIGIGVMVMLFAALTSAYIVRKGAGYWTEFDLPRPFFVSAIIMLASSFTIAWAVRSFKRDDLNMYRITLALTLTLSFAFCFSQYIGWQELQNIGIYLEGNPAGSFVYVISFIHVAHIAVGMLLIFGAYIRSLFFFRNPSNWLIWQQDENKKIRIELLATYWHFVDLLWLYLLAFFLYF